MPQSSASSPQPPSQPGAKAQDNPNPQPQPTGQGQPAPTLRRPRWRIVDAVTAAVLGAATGFLFVAWNIAGGAWTDAFNALTPGLGGFAIGPWLLGGVLGGLIIRKPWAAIFVELVAAIVSAMAGNQWGIAVVYSGIVQGIGAELVFLALRYKRFGIAPAVFSGMGAAAGAFILEFFLGNIAKTVEFNIIYLVTTQISGAVLAGVLGWLLVRALAATGALDRFAAGRERRKLV